MRLLVLSSLLLLWASASAQVYKWKDQNGVTHYADKPGVAGAQPVKLPGLQGYSLSGKTSAKKFSGPAPYGGSGPKIEITQPAPDSTLPADGRFTVMVGVNLAGGQKLNYYLDGELQNPVPTVSTAFLYTGAEKGDHMLSVAVTDADGRELSRSEPVLVHLQPAVAKR